MKSTLYALTTAVVLAVSTPAVLTASPKDEAAVREHCASFVAAWNKHDAKAMAATWAEDGNLINPFGKTASGRAEVEKLLTEEHKTVMAGTTYTATAVSVQFLTPTIAVSDWASVVTGMHDPKGAELPPFKHHVLMVAVQKDGKWSTAVARAYADLPPPPADAAK